MKILIITMLLVAPAAHAELGETFEINGKTFTDKSAAIQYNMSLGKAVEVKHTRCEILTNKLTFKACPKSAKNFANQPFGTK